MRRFFLLFALAVIAANAHVQTLTNGPVTATKSGRELFLKNCAHCHGADARGDEGPDLHDLDWTKEQIAKRICHGKKSKMTAFAKKLTPEEIDALVAYVRALQ